MAFAKSSNTAFCQTWHLNEKWWKNSINNVFLHRCHSIKIAYPSLHWFTLICKFSSFVHHFLTKLAYFSNSKAPILKTKEAHRATIHVMPTCRASCLDDTCYNQTSAKMMNKFKSCTSINDQLTIRAINMTTENNEKLSLLGRVLNLT